MRRGESIGRAVDAALAVNAVEPELLLPAVSGGTLSASANATSARRRSECWGGRIVGAVAVADAELVAVRAAEDVDADAVRVGLGRSHSGCSESATVLVLTRALTLERWALAGGGAGGSIVDFASLVDVSLCCGFAG